MALNSFSLKKQSLHPTFSRNLFHSAAMLGTSSWHQVQGPILPLGLLKYFVTLIHQGRNVPHWHNRLQQLHRFVSCMCVMTTSQSSTSQRCSMCLWRMLGVQWIQTHQTKQSFWSLLLSSLVWVWVNCSFSFLFLAHRRGPCCCSPLLQGWTCSMFRNGSADH